MRQVGTSSTVCTPGQVWGPTVCFTGGLCQGHREQRLHLQRRAGGPVEQQSSWLRHVHPRFTLYLALGPIAGTRFIRRPFCEMQSPDNNFK